MGRGGTETFGDADMAKEYGRRRKREEEKSKGRVKI